MKTQLAPKACLESVRDETMLMEDNHSHSSIFVPRHLQRKDILSNNDWYFENITQSFTLTLNDIRSKELFSSLIDLLISNSLRIHQSDLHLPKGHPGLRLLRTHQGRFPDHLLQEPWRTKKTTLQSKVTRWTTLNVKSLLLISQVMYLKFITRMFQEVLRRAKWNRLLKNLLGQEY